MRSCGAKLTRACVEDYLRAQKAYTGHGLLTPRKFVVSRPGPTLNSCINVARWQDSADGGKGGWVSQVPDMNTNCFNVFELAYSP
jgi:branched-chain amino acid transport system substrate-binding protein